MRCDLCRLTDDQDQDHLMWAMSLRDQIANMIAAQIIDDRRCAPYLLDDYRTFVNHVNHIRTMRNQT